MIKAAVFASGTGSNFEVLCKDEKLREIVDIKLLVCDNKNALVIQKAENFNIDTLVVDPKDFANKLEFENHILQHLNDIDYIFLAGYMRIISPHFLENFKGKILNIHPSLLPNYKGKDAILRAFENREEKIGVSIHFVNEEVDGGEIIAQDYLIVDYNDSLDNVIQKIHEIEHKLYSKTLINLFGGSNEKSTN